MDRDEREKPGPLAADWEWVGWGGEDEQILNSCWLVRVRTEGRVLSIKAYFGKLGQAESKRSGRVCFIVLNCGFPWKGGTIFFVTRSEGWVTSIGKVLEARVQLRSKINSTTIMLY